MLIDLYKSKRKHRMEMTGVIHVGAHYGEEYEVYRRCGITPIVFIEPMPDAFSVLRGKFEHTHDVKLYQMACGATRKTGSMHVETANKGQSNSLLPPKTHLTHYPNIVFNDTAAVEVVPLDDINLTGYNTLVMDVQGYELEVLKGATETLMHIKYVYTEVNTQELYDGCAQLTDITRFLRDFRRVELRMTNQGWGDAIFTRR